MINQQQKDILNKWAAIKKDINVLEKQAEELKEEVGNILISEEVGEVSIGDDKISLSSRRTWKYPEEITEREKTLKADKKTAEQLGTAKYTEKFFPMFSDSDNKKERNYE